jgi:hypothetical protein
VLQRMLAGVLAKRRACVEVAEQLDAGIGERARVAWQHHPPGVADHLEHAAHADADDWPAAEHRLDHRER